MTTEPRVTYDISDYHGTAYNNLRLNLDPNWGEDDKPSPIVSTWANVGSGCPQAVFDNRHLTLTGLDADYVAESLEEYLRELEDDLVAIAEGYRGTTWTGSNWVGEWSDESIERAEELSNLIAEAIQLGTVNRYVAANDWFVDSPDLFDAKSCDSVKEWAGVERDNASGAGVILAQDDTEELLRGYLERTSEELADEGKLDEEDKDDLALCRRLFSN